MATRRLAPAALGEVPHHSALGHHGIATHCPDTGQLLTGRCPKCARTLWWGDADLTRCRGCGRDLREHLGDRLPSGIQHATRLMIGLIHPHPDRHARAASDLPPPLAHLDRGAAFELGWRMGCVLTGRGLGARDAAQNLPVEDRLAIMAAGAKALAGWPDSLSAALRGGGVAGEAQVSSLVHEVRMIARAQNAWPSVRDAVIAAAPALSVSAAAAVRSVMPGSVRGTDAQRALGVSRNVMRRLRKETDALVPVHDTGTVHRFQVFANDNIEHVRSLLADRTAFSTVCQTLGISRHGVEQLCCLGRLSILDNDVAVAALADRHVLRAGVDRLVADIVGANRIGASEDAVPLRRAMLTIGAREKPWGPVLVAMADGGLPFHLDPSGSDLLVERVSIAASDVHLLSSLGFREDEYAGFPFEDGMKREDAEEALNLSPRQFQEAVSEEEVAADSDGMYDRGAVRDLATRYVSGGEILMRWCGGGRSKPEQFRGPRRLVRAARLGWLRDEVEREMAGTPPFFSRPMPSSCDLPRIHGLDRQGT